MYEDILTFAAVVEHGSINKASQVLNISQPALSRKISGLEQRLGISLFTRTGNRLELTRLGRISYEYAVEMRQLQNKFQQTIATHLTEGRSSLTIGASLTTLQATLPELIAMFMKDWPHTDIKAITGKTHEIVAMVAEHRVDLGLVASSIEHPELQCLPLFDDYLCLVVPRHHPLANINKSLPIHSLNGLPMILFSKGTWYRILMDELFKQYAIFPDVKMEIDSFEAILRLVSTCQSAALLPKSYLHPQLLDNSDLVVLDILELEQTTRTTSLIFTDLESLNTSTIYMVEKAMAYFSNRLQK